MSKMVPRLAPVLLACALGALNASAAQSSLALLHSLYDPGTNTQVLARQGYSTALDGNLAVVGAPLADGGARHSGMVLVYDATTGSLLYSLTNPSPVDFERFGESVAVSGTRIVVGSFHSGTATVNLGSAYVYDLAGPAPTLPMLTLTNPNPATGRDFGSSVSISGGRVAVGAPGDNAGGFRSGRAYVFELDGATPHLPVATLNNPSPASDDGFGTAVGIFDSWAVVGAPGDGAGASLSGSAYLFNLAAPTSSVPVITLTNPVPNHGDNFGRALAISGSRIIVGVPGANTITYDVGKAYVFDFTRVFPTIPVVTLNNPSPVLEEFFGMSASIHGTRVVIGATRGIIGAVNAGAAYVFDLGGATPTEPIVTLNNPSPNAEDLFGCAVAISGTRLLVGAQDDDNGAPLAGNAYLYDLGGATPAVPVTALVNPTRASSDLFGIAVAVSGSRLVVGAHASDTGAVSAGAAYVYDLAGPTPGAPFLALTNPSPVGSGYFGGAVAISGARLVVGAYGNDIGANSAGSAYVYDLSGATPEVPVLTLTNPQPADTDFFGDAGAIHGTRIVIGASPDNAGIENAASAYVYELTSATPAIPVLMLTNPSPAVRDYFGNAVALEGSRLAIGASRDNAGTNDAGSVYVYDLSSATPALPVLTLTNPLPVEAAFFGKSVALSGNLLLVGAYEDVEEDARPGAAFLFDLESAVPAVPVSQLINPSSSLYDGFGASVALSGGRAMVGALWEDAGAVGAGAVHVYDFTGATVTFCSLTVTNPTRGYDARMGYSVATEGTILVAGTPLDDTGGPNRGAAFVFSIGPNLLLSPAAPGLATLSWTPTNSPGFVLQYADSLAPTNWVNAPSGAANPVTVPSTGPARFYRLAQP